MRIVDIVCWWKGHTWKFKDFHDGEEWPGPTFFVDAVQAVYGCTRCGTTGERFVCWGTMAESEESLNELRKEYEGYTNL
jgi:hypothetical protein